jgi:DNA-binding transcriptional LysR family regulator
MPALPRLRFTFAQLRALEAVARNASFTRAAEELHLAQPTISIQVKELGDSFGVPLLDVSGRRVRPTQAGAEVLATARRVFEEFASLDMRLAELQGLRRGRLRIAAVTTAEYFIPDLLGPFARHYPEIEVALAVENRDRVVTRLEANADDLYVMMMPPPGDHLVAVPFLENPLVPVADVSHPLAGKQGIPVTRLARERFVLREAGSGTRMACEAFFREHGLAPEVKLELGSNEAVKHAVAAGLGIAILSAHTLGAQHERSGLTVLDVRGFPIKRCWYVVRPAERALTPVARAFLEFVRSIEPSGEGAIGEKAARRREPRRARAAAGEA